MQLWDTILHMHSKAKLPGIYSKTFGHSYAENFSDYFKSHIDSRISKGTKRYGIELFLNEDNAACISIIMSGRNPTMRHLGRVHRVDVAWLHHEFNVGTYALGYCESELQAADIFTKAPTR
jgi:hypothetical protein